MARILIVDDDTAFLSTLESSLQASGHAVVTAQDGVQAAKLFRAEPFEVILTDIVMPNREGLETIIELRREFPGTQVIAMSGGVSLSPFYLKMAQRLGAHYSLAKPFTREQLTCAISTVLRQKNG